jgi:polyhydroxybutyrate depolymerase
MARWVGVAAVGLAAGCVTELPSQADPCATWEQPGLYTWKTDVGDKTRKAYVFVPPTAGPRDLVVALHGAGQTAREFADRSQFIRHAEQNNYVAVYPSGQAILWKHGWNAGECCGNLKEDIRNAEDVRFLEQLVAELSVEVCGDRVLATGFSNGGMMAHRWACEGEEPDAVVSAAGTLAFFGECTGDPVPIRHYHGTADPRVPEEGEASTLMSVDETMAIWRERNECTDDPPDEQVTGPMTCTAWECAAPTEQCTIEGWDHRWPGGVNRDAIGKPSRPSTSCTTACPPATTRRTPPLPRSSG